MMSISKISLGQAGYYIDLQAADYYTKGGEPPGYWIGQGCDHLHLSGQVEQGIFTNIFNGLTPDGQQSLTQRQRYTVAHAGCGKLRQRQAGWDVVFSVPKSASVCAAVAPHELRHKIETVAIPNAVRKGIEYLQEHAACTRRGQGGKRREQGQIVVAAFPHTTSRDLDPQYHVHCVVMNACVRKDGTVGTLESRPLYEHKMAAGAAFRAALAEELTQLGFSCVQTRHAFKIEGIPDELCDHFSKRRKAVVEHLAELGRNTPADAARATLATRHGKAKVPPREQLLRQWQAEAERFEITPAVITEIAQWAPRNGRDFSDYPDIDQNVRTAQAAAGASTVERSAVPSPDADQRTRAVVSRPKPDVREPVKPSARRQKSREQRVPDPSPAAEHKIDPNSRHIRRQQYELATRIGQVSMDRRFILSDKAVARGIAKYSQPRSQMVEEMRHHASQLVKASRSQRTRRINRPQIARQARETLNEDGKSLVCRLTQKRGRVVVVTENRTEQRYLAIKAAADCWRRAGYQVIACSPSHQLTKEFEQETSVAAVTQRRLQMMLNPSLAFQLKHHARQFVRAARNRPTYRLDTPRIDRSKILIVDRADRLSLDDLSQLVGHVERYGGKVVLLAPPILDTPDRLVSATAQLLNDLPRLMPQDISLHYVRKAYESTYQQYQQPSMEGR